MEETANHQLNKYSEGETDWTHAPDMQHIEERLVVRDTEANLSNYTPHATATFIATDTGAVYDGDGGSWSSATRAVGVAPEDGAGAVEDAIDALPSSGGTVRIRRGEGQWSDGVVVTSDNVDIELSAGTTITVDDSDWSTLSADSNTNIPDKKAVFTFSDVENCCIRGGTIDGVGFGHDSETDACGVWVRGDESGCENVSVEDVTVKNINPDVTGEDEFGGWSDNGTRIRYQGILIWKSKNVSVNGCSVENIKYGAISARGDYDGVRITNNYAADCFECVQAGSTVYGTGNEINDPLYNSIQRVIVSDNTFEQAAAAAVASHANNITVVDNDIHNTKSTGYASGYGIAFLDGGTSGGPFTAAGNDIDADIGIRVGGSHSQIVAVVMNGNTITASDQAIRLDGALAEITISANTVLNATTGVNAVDEPDNLLVANNNLVGASTPLDVSGSAVTSSNIT